MNRLESVPDALFDRVSRVQRELFLEIQALLAQFERDGQFITTSPENIARLNQLKAQIRQVLFGSDYLRAVRDFASEFDTQADINATIYASTLEYTESAVTAALVNQSKRDALNALLGGALDAEFYSPIYEVINSAVSTGAGFDETVKSLRLFIEGGGAPSGSSVEGKLLRYVKQIASDAFALSDRAFNNNASAELDIEFYLYAGGVIESSREFCTARNGKYFHQKEIEQWVTGGGSPEGNPKPNVEWQGQYRGTNSASIFTYCGGYQCKHSLLPISIAAVPKDVIRRNIANGNVALTAKQQEVLGI